MLSLRPSLELDVLLVEDNEDDVEAVRRVFARNSLVAQLDLARDGEEAIDVLAKKIAEPAWHLVLLDLSLPKVDGRDILRWIKAHPRLRSIPVVVISGSGAQETIRECMELGCHMYLLKPIDIADIANIVWSIARFWTGPATFAQKAA